MHGDDAQERCLSIVHTAESRIGKCKHNLSAAPIRCLADEA